MQKKTFLLYILYILLFSSNLSNAKVRTTVPIQTSLVVDIKTGKVLHQQNACVKIYPASLIKLMTLYLLFEHVESGKLTMNQKLLVSKNAEKMLSSKLGLKAGEFITVRDAILGLIVKSANDVAVTVAENIRGTEANFAKLMNVRAKQLGMRDTNFKNASGWHNSSQKTTARDLIKLSIALKRDYPKYYSFFSRTSFIFRGNIVRGHNKIIEHYKGAEGLKTGYTTPSGFNLATTASKNNKSLVAIVTGSKSAASRDQKMIQLLDKCFCEISQKTTISTKANNKKLQAITHSKVKKNNKKKSSS